LEKIRCKILELSTWVVCMIGRILSPGVPSERITKKEGKVVLMQIALRTPLDPPCADSRFSTSMFQPMVFHTQDLAFSLYSVLMVASVKDGMAYVSLVSHLRLHSYT